MTLSLFNKWRCACLTIFFLAAALSPLAAHPKSVSNYEQMAIHDVLFGQYARASSNYELAADYYRRIGDRNRESSAAYWADQLSTTIKLFIDSPDDPASVATRYTGAKFEPVHGCYVGAYTVSDYNLPAQKDPDGKKAPSEQVLGTLMHKHLATAFDYCSYGKPFPLEWAKSLSAHGIAPHIALEPNDGLGAVNDDAYLQAWARDAASCGGPVFLRFASEMNGDWTVYHGNPALYREKFRLVHDVMARLAPNVAMIWCVFQSPEENWDSYYPGDDVVDWVGINIYSVMHHDNLRQHPAWFESPGRMLEHIYAKYSSRKPIAVCEFGASHREEISGGIEKASFASGKLLELFASLPRRFPRIKLVDLFDCDNLRYGPTGRKLNDYCITDCPPLMDAVRRAVAPSYFLSSVQKDRGGAPPPYPLPLAPQAQLSGVIHLSASVNSWDERPQVVYTSDGGEIARICSGGPFRLDLDTTKLSPGRHLLSVRALNNRGDEVARQEMPVVFIPPVAPVVAAVAPSTAIPATTLSGANRAYRWLALAGALIGVALLLGALKLAADAGRFSLPKPFPRRKGQPSSPAFPAAAPFRPARNSQNGNGNHSTAANGNGSVHPAPDGVGRAVERTGAGFSDKKESSAKSEKEKTQPVSIPVSSGNGKRPSQSR
ncbi:MAG: glycoside hydrolase family 26 protein, partial [Armatimonadota bacterium]|nr:glycoside hydrolase family 26 protein [Armatimonadota bacterium]